MACSIRNPYAQRRRTSRRPREFIPVLDRGNEVVDRVKNAMKSAESDHIGWSTVEIEWSSDFNKSSRAAQSWWS